MRVSSLYVYPIKSSAPLPLSRAAVEPRGLRDDRRWMVVDGDGNFVTGRQIAGLTRIHAEPTATGLRLSAPGAAPIDVATPAPEHASRIEVQVWKDRVAALAVDPAADRWLSERLQTPVRLMFMDAGAVRPVASGFGRDGDQVSFADGFPLLLISQGSLDGLNARLAQPVSMLRFRPNVVVDGCAAHAEDRWRRLRMGDIEFDVAKACRRCVFTTVEPERGERDPSGEPLRTLVEYRRREDGVYFGQLLIPRGSGTIETGAPVVVLDD